MVKTVANERAPVTSKVGTVPQPRALLPWEKVSLMLPNLQIPKRNQKSRFLGETSWFLDVIKLEKSMYVL